MPLKFKNDLEIPNFKLIKTQLTSNLITSPILTLTAQGSTLDVGVWRL